MGRRFGYFFRETFTAVRRNALVTFAAVSTVFISLFLLGGSLLVERQVRLMAGEWASKVEVSVFIRDTASTDQITALGRKINEMPEVDRVFFESREEAYQRFRKLFADSTSLIENVSADAMPQSYRVKLKDPEKFAVIRARLAGDPTVEEVRDEQRLLKNLFAVTRVLRTGVQAVAIIMLVAAAGLIGNTLRAAVFARPKEIPILKIIGAGILIAAVASLVAMRRFLDV